MNKVVMVLALILILTGCAAARTTLRHPDTQAQVTCERSGWYGFGGVGMAIALVLDLVQEAQYRACLKGWVKSGYAVEATYAPRHEPGEPPPSITDEWREDRQGG